jgi:glycosyltransferase involved in cell wall biosynthesis
LTPVRVGLNLVPLTQDGGGIARYGVELAAALARRDDVELRLFTALDAPAELREADWLGRVRVTRFPVRVSGPPVHLAAQFAAIPALALAHRLDVVHSPANAGPVGVPGVRWVVTLHDTIWLRSPEDWGTPRAVRSMHRVAIPTVRRADRVITGTEDAARDIEQMLGVPRSRMDLAYHGVRVNPAAPATAAGELRRSLRLGDAPVILCVAQKRPYKNQEALVRALADPRLASAVLVLPGRPSDYEARLEEQARELGVEDRVRLPDWLPDADIEGLYRLATCVALPSRQEGFGLPAIEAMARGVAVACSDRGALREVVGDAALLFDPGDDGAAATALAQLVSDEGLRARLAGRGRERAARFTWEAAADATAASYRRALGR